MLSTPTTMLEAAISHLGKSVITLENIHCGEMIIKFGGELITRLELPDIITPEDDRYLQISLDLYLGPSGKLDDLINHSCSPNAGIRQQGSHFYLIAISNIPAKEEITFDYSSTMVEDNWSMNCLCPSPQCRRIIREFSSLPQSIKQRYIRLGIVPDHVLSAEKKLLKHKNQCIP